MRKTILYVTLLFAATSSNALDLAGMDKSVRPGDNFFAYANGAWFKATQIPADRSNVGVFSNLSEEANKRTVDLIQHAGKSQIGDYYAAFMDEKTIESKGTAPLKPELNAIAALQDKAALATFLGGQLRADVDPLNFTNLYTDRLFGLFVSPDFNAPEHNSAYLLQGGLGMPDRDNYLSKDAHDVELQKKYQQHIASALRLAGFTDVDARAARIYALEYKIANAHATRTDSEDVHKANNPWKPADYSKNAPGLDWPRFFNAAGLSNQPLIFAWQPKAITGIAALVGSEPIATWKDYLAFHAIDRGSPYLPKTLVDERFRFYGTALSGIPTIRDRWKRGVDATNAALGDAVGQLYVKRYFPPAAKATAQQMVKNIEAAFRARIDRLAWMSPATRAKAKAKLDTLYVGIGYPEKWRDYSGLKVDPADAFGNAQRSELFDYHVAIAKLGKPVDKTEWWLNPQTVNALNVPLQNALNFPAAILVPPFFDAARDPVENYGAIGSVIGHEISHSFDDQGSQFDANGKLANWWTKEDFAHFSAAASRLAAEYDKYEPLPGLHVNGKLTLGENIADVAGISAAYDAYRLAGANKPAQGFTGDQRFFLAFAQDYRSKLRPEAQRVSLRVDGHAPSEYRADTVRNIDAWYDAFHVTPGQKLYLAPADRVRVW